MLPKVALELPLDISPLTVSTWLLADIVRLCDSILSVLTDPLVVVWAVMSPVKSTLLLVPKVPPAEETVTLVDMVAPAAEEMPAVSVAYEYARRKPPLS